MRQWVLGGLLGGLAAWTGLDQPPPPLAPTLPDWVVAHNARRTLWSDPNLAELNLGVTVRNGEALVWGPVLNSAQTDEAIARVKLVPGVNAVINELYVLPPNDLLRRQLPTLRSAPVKRKATVPNSEDKSPPSGVRPIPSQN